MPLLPPPPNDAPGAGYFCEKKGAHANVLTVRILLFRLL